MPRRVQITEPSTSAEIVMELIKSQTNACASLVPEQIVQEITEQDRDRLFAVTSTDLNDAQRTRLTTPARTHPLQREVLAVHWHPEFVPMDINRQRIEATFPKEEQELIIPTQHNEILTYDDYAGVEVDCFSHGFNQKVQLLLHFSKENVEDASVLRAMLAHTYQYRASQLFEFMHTVTRPRADRLDEAARETGAGEDIVMFVQTY